MGDHSRSRQILKYNCQQRYKHLLQNCKMKMESLMHFVHSVPNPTRPSLSQRKSERHLNHVVTLNHMVSDLVSKNFEQFEGGAADYRRWSIVLGAGNGATESSISGDRQRRSLNGRWLSIRKDRMSYNLVASSEISLSPLFASRLSPEINAHRYSSLLLSSESTLLNISVSYV